MFAGSEAFHRPCHRVLEKMPEPQHVRVHGLDRVLPIVDRRSDRGRVNDEVDLPQGGALAHVPLLPDQVRATAQRLHPARQPSRVAVPGHEAAPAIDECRLVQPQEVVDELATQKSRRTGQQDGLAAKTLIELA
jgi:hypothetical protein